MILPTVYHSKACNCSLYHPCHVLAPFGFTSFMFSTVKPCYCDYVSWHLWWHMEQSLVYVCFTNNLFIIAKCTYATPDPVQLDQHYLCVHCVYPLCLFTHIPCISPANVTLLSYLNILPSYCQCPSPIAELPAPTL